MLPPVVKLKKYILNGIIIMYLWKNLIFSTQCNDIISKILANRIEHGNVNIIKANGKISHTDTWANGQDLLTEAACQKMREVRLDNL